MEAADGRDALTQALGGPPTIVITEMRLPFVDGVALCEILRRDASTSHVPILVATSEVRQVHAERIRQAGADIVLVKPTPIDQILLAAQQWVTNRTATQDGGADRAPSTVPEPSLRRLTTRTQSFSRFTTRTPPTFPPQLRCPLCDGPLTYKSSYVGGMNVSRTEQWDSYLCDGSCGTFEFRQRTRKLRRVS